MHLNEDEFKEYTREALRYIKNTYFLFKVCEGCDGIVYYTTPVCSTCKSYRFDESRTRILESIKLIKNYKIE